VYFISQTNTVQVQQPHLQQQQYTPDLPKPMSSSSESVSSFCSSFFSSSFLDSSAGAAPVPPAAAGAAAELPTLLMRSLMLQELSARANSAAGQIKSNRLFSTAAIHAGCTTQRQ